MREESGLRLRPRLSSLACTVLVVLPPLLFAVLFIAVDAQDLTVDEDFRDDFEESTVLELDGLTDLAFSPDGEFVLLTAKVGKVLVLEDFHGDQLSQEDAVHVALDISNRICSNGERGLLAATIHPDFPHKPYVYLYYTHLQDQCYTGTYSEHGSGRGTFNRLSRFVLSRALASPDGTGSDSDSDSDSGNSVLRIDETSEIVFLETIVSPVHNHCGGDVAFGPDDGLLYAAIGDHGTAGKRPHTNDEGIYYGMALDNLVGKVVRLTEDGNVPQDNPYTPANGYNDDNSVLCGKNRGEAGDSSRVCREIYAAGLRNPFRFAFDPNPNPNANADGGSALWINDVGWNQWERIVECRKGANYGYPIQDGPCQNVGGADETCGPTEYTEHMVHFYPHTDYGGAITAGTFVPDYAGWPESFRGAYLYGDYKQAGIYRITPDPSASSGGGGEGKGCLTCDPPVSAYASTTRILSATKRPVAMEFGPHRGGGYALYYVKFIKNLNRDGIPGLFRIAFVAGAAGANRTPKAIIDVSATIGFGPLTVQFDGTGSFDPDGDGDGDLSYDWDFDGDGLTDSTSPITSYEFKSPGTYPATLTVGDTSGAESTATQVIEVDDNGPVVLIESPFDSTTFAVGDVISLKGSALDYEDGPLPESSLSWQVVLQQDGRYYPILEPTLGNNIDVKIPAPPSFFVGSTTSYLVVAMEATDSAGTTMEARNILIPRHVEIDFDSDPSGLRIIVSGDIFTTPTTVSTWENNEIQVDAPPQTMGGIAYAWESWSTGGSQSHTFKVPASSQSLILANFRVVASSEGGDLHLESPESLTPTEQVEHSSGLNDFESEPEFRGRECVLV